MAQVQVLISNVREWREAVGFSQEQLARHCGVTRAAVSAWEKDTRPDLLHAIILAEVLGCDVSDLFYLEEGVS